MFTDYERKFKIDIWNSPIMWKIISREPVGYVMIGYPKRRAMPSYPQPIHIQQSRLVNQFIQLLEHLPPQSPKKSRKLKYHNNTNALPYKK